MLPLLLQVKIIIGEIIRLDANDLFMSLAGPVAVAYAESVIPDAALNTQEKWLIKFAQLPLRSGLMLLQLNQCAYSHRLNRELSLTMRHDLPPIFIDTTQPRRWQECVNFLNSSHTPPAANSKTLSGPGEFDAVFPCIS